MLISRGESLEHPCLACDEIHALVRVETPVREYLATILESGVAHHVIVVHADAFEELEMVADAMGVQKLVRVGWSLATTRAAVTRTHDRVVASNHPTGDARMKCR